MRRTSAGADDIVTNLDVPWGIAFLPDGSALIAERDSGAIKHMSAPGVVIPLGAWPASPRVARAVCLGSPRGSHGVRLRHDGAGQPRGPDAFRSDGALTEQSPLLTGIPAGSIHDGGRIAFGPDGKLYVATGDTGDRQLSQDRSSLSGKILRINPDGSVPPDNPDPASPVWSLGHRNIQGLAWDSAGQLWATEYGANRVDELNVIQPGSNYGWPMAEGAANTQGLIDPVVQWSTDEASPSGLAYFGGSLWVAALRGERLIRIPVAADGSAASPASLFVGQYGRLRTVVAAPDGTLWFTTSNRDGRGDPRDGDDRILQFRP